ncbi:MAG: hypothetical protein GY821_03420 [Gammaproteobacteria bacterium]|nr:hypothetical protein [Gammaproteobacteria bacterium]
MPITKGVDDLSDGRVQARKEELEKLNDAQIEEEISNKVAKEIKAGYYKEWEHDYKTAVNSSHEKNIYLVKSEDDKKISRCLMFPDAGSSWHGYETINIEREDFDKDMEEAIRQIPKKTLKKDQAVFDGARSYPFRKLAVLKMVKEQEDIASHGLYSWKSRWIQHAFDITIGKKKCFTDKNKRKTTNKYKLSIENITTKGIDGECHLNCVNSPLIH